MTNTVRSVPVALVAPVVRAEVDRVAPARAGEVADPAAVPAVPVRTVLVDPAEDKEAPVPLLRAAVVVPAAKVADPAAGKDVRAVLAAQADPVALIPARPEALRSVPRLNSNGSQLRSRALVARLRERRSFSVSYGR
jgi:hypothetical protein